MTRHAKNCTAGAVYTYNEKKKDTKQSGYGSQKLRFGKDSIKEFDCCCLTLQPCRDPLLTLDGYLYDKEAILENIIHQKKEITRQLKQYEKQKKKKAAEAAGESSQAEVERLKKFLATESSILTKSHDPQSKEKEEEPSLNNMQDGKKKELPSFWIPSLTPQAKKDEIKKPDETIRCPMSGKPLKFKDLISIHFKPINDGDSKTAIIAKTDRYVCAVTNDILGNSVPCAALKTSGAVVTVDYVEKLLKKDMIDPINGKKLKDSDIILFQRGSSGFASSGVQLQGKKEGPGMMAS